MTLQTQVPHLHFQSTLDINAGEKSAIALAIEAEPSLLIFEYRSIISPHNNTLPLHSPVLIVGGFLFLAYS
jgi:hypothetical protein